MRAVDIIAKKRDGEILSHAEIEFFIKGYTSGEITDYQAAAWAMAVYLRGMNEDETTALTLAMAHSGEMIDLSDVASTVLDKHSSGGVGDKTTLVVAPIIAALGLPVGKMSGRGLGFSGGTLDKLESIPGFKINLHINDFKKQLAEHGIVVSGQTSDLAPADGKLYALRDVTATIGCLPLIASSIMSKKIAAGAQIILLDVKVGRGAFMKTLDQAEALARLMVKIGQGVGRRVGAAISAMDQPLGNAVGNALEVIEAVETLKGRGPADFTEHCVESSAQMLVLANATRDLTDARAQVNAAINDGRALKKFNEWILAQGAQQPIENNYAHLARAPIIDQIFAQRAGYITSINAEEVGWMVVELGGGRAHKSDQINHAVGVEFQHKAGDYVERGDFLFTVHASHQDRCEQAKQRLLAAIEFGEQPPTLAPLIHQVIT